MRVLDGRVAVVTGAAGGLGRALALELAGAGMKLSLADIDEQGMRAVSRELSERGARAICTPTDVRDARDLERLLRETVSKLEGCHLMCNNAGVFHAAGILEAPTAQWQRVIDVNLWGVIHGCRIFGAHFAAQREGHLLNTASAAGLFPIPGMSSYSTTKFAVVAFSQQLRWELASEGVGVTVLCPGVIRTAMAKARDAGLEHVDVDELVKRAPTPEGLARKAARAIRKNRPMVLYGPDAGIFRVLRLFPAWLIDPLGRYMGRKGLEAARPPALPAGGDGAATRD